MKYDWKYVSEEKAQKNIVLAAAEVITKLAEEKEADQIIGVCMLMKELMATMEDDDESGDK